MRADRAGVVALIFAILSVPMCMLAALVIDYGWVLQAKSALDLAADAAALAGARTAGAGYAAGQSSAVYMAEGTAAASQWWAAQAGTVPYVQSLTGTPVITQNGQSFTATFSYTATITEVIPQIFAWKNPNTGAANANIASSSTAVIIVNAYGTVDFLLDNTSSMMLPATTADLLALQSFEAVWLKSTTNQQSVINGATGLTGWNSANNSGITISSAVSGYSIASNAYCAFACHWVAGSSALNPLDYYGVARLAGETLRFDVVQSATVTAIQEMVTQEQALGQLNVGVFAFGGPAMSSSAYLKTIYPETPIDLTVAGITVKGTGALAAIAALALISPPVTGDVANTNIGNALAYTLAMTGPGGNGNTASTPRRSLILVTDGVEDDTNPQSIPSTEGPINPAVCTAMKNANYTIYVLYTPYNYAPVYLPNNMALQPYITGAAAPNILSALQSCASSPSDVIVANAPADIQAGIVALMDEAVGNTTRLSN